MADRKLISIDTGTQTSYPNAGFHTAKTAEGETRTGSTKDGAQGVLYVQTGNAVARTLNNGQIIPAKCASLGSVLALDGVDATGAATTWYYFTTSAGVLRRSSTMPTNTESDGTAV